MLQWIYDCIFRPDTVDSSEIENNYIMNVVDKLYTSITHSIVSLGVLFIYGGYVFSNSVQEIDGSDLKTFDIMTFFFIVQPMLHSWIKMIPTSVLEPMFHGQVFNSFVAITGCISYYFTKNTTFLTITYFSLYYGIVEFNMQVKNQAIFQALPFINYFIHRFTGQNSIVILLVHSIMFAQAQSERNDFIINLGKYLPLCQMLLLDKEIKKEWILPTLMIQLYDILHHYVTNVDADKTNFIKRHLIFLTLTNIQNTGDLSVGLSWNDFVLEEYSLDQYQLQAYNLSKNLTQLNFYFTNIVNILFGIYVCMVAGIAVDASNTQRTYHQLFYQYFINSSNIVLGVVGFFLSLYDSIYCYRHDIVQYGLPFTGGIMQHIAGRVTMINQEPLWLVLVPFFTDERDMFQVIIMILCLWRFVPKFTHYSIPLYTFWMHDYILKKSAFLMSITYFIMVVNHNFDHKQLYIQVVYVYGIMAYWMTLEETNSSEISLSNEIEALQTFMQTYEFDWKYHSITTPIFNYFFVIIIFLLS